MHAHRWFGGVHVSRNTDILDLSEQNINEVFEFVMFNQS